MRIVKQNAKEGEIRLTPENLEDLWHIERILSSGDQIVSKSWRRFKATETDAGEKKPVTIRLEAEKVEFAKYANRLRVTGKIIEGTPVEFVQKGSYHTIDIEPGFPVSIIKKKWMNHQLMRIRQAVKETKRPKLGILVLDEKAALYATLRGFGVQYEIELENKASKKDKNFEEKNTAFYNEIIKKLVSSKVGRIIVAGPGFGKENLFKFIKQKEPELAKRIVLEYCSSAERTGVNELLKSGAISKLVEGERTAQELELMEKFSAEIGKQSGLAAYGLEQVKAAVNYSAVGTLMVLDELLRSNKQVEQIVEQAEKKKVKLVIFSHESDGGGQLEGFGGFAALLRFKIR